MYIASRLFSWSVSILLTLGFCGTADAMHERCPGCSAAQMGAVARSRGAGTWVAWNPTNADVRRYDVSCGIVEETNSTTCTSIETLVSQSVRDTAAALHQLHQMTGGTYFVRLDINASDWNVSGHPNAATAHTYATDANYRAQLNSHLGQEGLHHTTSPSAIVLDYLENHIDSTLEFIEGVRMTINLAFEDGSKVKIKLKLDQSTEYVVGSARDSGGQFIPDLNTRNYIGTWKYAFGDPNRTKIENSLRQLGVKIATARRDDEFLRCSWNASKQSLTCSWSEV